MKTFKDKINHVIIHLPNIILHCFLYKLHKDLYIKSLRNCYAFLKCYYNRNFLGGGDYCIVKSLQAKFGIKVLPGSGKVKDRTLITEYTGEDPDDFGDFVLNYFDCMVQELSVNNF